MLLAADAYKSPQAASGEPNTCTPHTLYLRVMVSNSTRSRNGSSQGSSTRDQRRSTHPPHPYYIDPPSQGQPLPYYPHPDYSPVEQDFSHYGYRALPTYAPSQTRRSTAGPPSGSTTAHTDYYATQGAFTGTSSHSSSHSGHVHQTATIQRAPPRPETFQAAAASHIWRNDPPDHRDREWYPQTGNAYIYYAMVLCL